MPITKHAQETIDQLVRKALADPENPPKVYHQDYVTAKIAEGENGIDVTGSFIARWHDGRWRFTCSRPVQVTHVAGREAYVVVGGAQPGFPERFGVGSTIEVTVEQMGVSS